MNPEIPAIEGGTPIRKKMLPFHRASIGREEERAVIDTLRSGWLTTGPQTKQFEKELADFLDVEKTLCLNSCTSALALALAVFNIDQDDEVITTPITFPSTANVIIHRRAKPVFADVNPETLNLNVMDVEKKISSKTKAIIPVHMAGQSCDLSTLRQLCDNHNLVLIQDAAHALESTWNDHKITQYGDLCTYSFYATKNITCGEGGAIAGNDSEILDRASLLSLFGISKDAWKRYNLPGYQHWETIEPGYKYNMFDIQASIGRIQLKRINEFRKRRLILVKKYDDAFNNHPGLIPIRTVPEANHAHYIYVIRLNLKRIDCSRDHFMKALESENIGVGIHFRSLLDQKYYRENFPKNVKDCPNAHEVSNSILSIPLYPLMTNADCEHVIQATLKILDYYLN